MGASLCRQGDEGETLVICNPEKSVGTPKAFLAPAEVKKKLPAHLSEAAVTALREASSVLLPHIEEISEHMYRRLAEEHGQLVDIFCSTSIANGQHQAAFASIIAMFIAYVGDVDKLFPLIELVAVRHAALDVHPHHYLSLHGLFLQAADDVLGSKLTTEVTAAWSQGLLFLFRLLVDREDALYKKAKDRSGGWNGFRTFVVLRREQQATDIVTITMKPLEYVGVYFDYSPGQFVSIKVKLNDGAFATRHYVLTSPPGSHHLQISVKRRQGGLVSNYLHDESIEGQLVLLSPPFGVFVPVARAERPCMPKLQKGKYNNSEMLSSVVVLSAGIGVMATITLCEAMRNRVAWACHIDSSEQTFPFRHRLLEACPHAEVHYTSAGGRPPMSVFSRAAQRIGVRHDWYVCGPVEFMRDVIVELVSAGVDAARIHIESYSPALNFQGGQESDALLSSVAARMNSMSNVAVDVAC